jgi:S-adenosyl methyltransferase
MGGDEEGRLPPFDATERPSVARVYDYYLGGTAHRPIDRHFADEVLASFPLVRPVARANRIFLQRAVRHLMRLGVRQFVDVGSGVPTMGSTYAVADEVEPGAARVVHADNDPAAVGHAREILARHGDPHRHAVVEADLRDPDELWRRVGATGLLDPTTPVALLLIAVLHLRQLADDPVSRLVSRYRELLPGGSYLAISHATKDGLSDRVMARVSGVGRLYGRHGSPAVWRTRRDIAGLFGDFELVEPGLTWTPLWHPEEAGRDEPAVTFESPDESIVLAGLARKP